MQTNGKKLLLVITIGFILVIGQFVYANTKEPGTDEDPLVTLSFVEQRIEQLRYYIDEKVKSSSGDHSIESGAGFEVAELKAGSSLIGGQSTELILRSGKATAIDSPMGGLSDVTGAKDLVKNENVPTNHLLIIPRDDGRGIKATTDIFVMVKGSYDVRW
ncbi:MAG: hypothetical protein ACOX0L_10460 [Natronincolaceae bacterium]|jgi:hypothetical protein|nr:hypothetical protein [Bacillota bacterium]NLK90693.1 hypothetical protein [Clostridiales bacterium]